jgi:hypothetical protein
VTKRHGDLLAVLAAGMLLLLTAWGNTFTLVCSDAGIRKRDS